MSNMLSMNDKIKGKVLLFNFATNQKVPSSIIDGVMENVH